MQHNTINTAPKVGDKCRFTGETIKSVPSTQDVRNKSVVMIWARPTEKR
jgi:hypothetical protein